MRINPELTFTNIDLNQAQPADLRRIGMGVAVEMADAFGASLSAQPTENELKSLVGAVGSAATLRDNVAHVQEVLGTDQNALEIAQSWVNRSGLLTPVHRSYMNAEMPEQQPDVVAMTDGMANWMQWRATNIVHGVEQGDIAVGTPVIMAANYRPMKTAERDDVEEGMTAYDYMEQVIVPQGSNLVVPRLVAVGERGKAVASGEEVAAAVAQEVESDSSRVLVVSNAGAWQQAAGQMRRALRGRFDTDYDARGDRLSVLAASQIKQPDGTYKDIAVGDGSEPRSQAQDPNAALGSVARGILEMRRHIA